MDLNSQIEQQVSNTFRQTFVKVDLQAIARNVQCVRDACPPGIQIAAVVKANAYGHGAIKIAQYLEEQKAVDAFVVMLVEEALELRSEGRISMPILIAAGLFSGAYDVILQNSFVPILSNHSDVVGISEAAKRNNSQADVHLEVDIGMSRLGFTPTEFGPILRTIRHCGNINVAGIMGHPAHANILPIQQERFHHALQTFEEDILENGADRDGRPYARQRCLSTCSSAGSETSRTSEESSSAPSSCSSFECRASMTDVICHIGNSGAVGAEQVRKCPDDGAQMVRVGLAIYGVQPNDNEADQIPGLRSAMSWYASVVGLRTIQAGETVSYDGTWRAQRTSVIATIAVGYADGYPRSLSDKGVMFVNGKRADVVGRICMDYTMIDVTHVNDVKIGTQVILFTDEAVNSPFGQKPPTIKEIARVADTIPWEILCRISHRVHRIYKND